MKTIQLQDHGPFKAREIIATIMRTPNKQDKGIDYAEMNKRVRVLEAIERLSDGADELHLEDADYAFLLGAMRAFSFGIADVGLHKVLKAIEDAQDAEQPAKLKKLG
jgi:hypothetical protein